MSCQLHDAYFFYQSVRLGSCMIRASKTGAVLSAILPAIA